ncbi:MAG: glucosamine-6-phosphate deaminase [Candidatus Brocadiaceae bacterium]|nr:glucosamine-6-phosphate deaminase [Candidatus Brocadiaceae bacterium]
MDVILVRDYEEMSARAAEIVIAALRQKPDAVLGLATGSSPEGLYARLIDAHTNDGLDFAPVVTFNLDEYVGLGPDHPQSYRAFMNDRLFDHINVKPQNTHVPDGLAQPLRAHCAAYEEAIRQAGGIDLQVLGIGRDGHIGFNEPGTSLGSRTHVAALAPETIEDNARYFAGPEEVPRFAVTMGIASILDARRCILLAGGAGKAEAVAAAIEGPLTSQVPASALQMHPDTVAIVDEAAAARLRRADFYRWQDRNRSQILDRL